MHYSNLNNIEHNKNNIISEVKSGIKIYLLKNIPWIVDLVDNHYGNTFNEKLYNLVFKPENHSCLNCGVNTKFYEKNFIRGYAKFCGYSCRAKFNECYKNAYLTDDIKIKRKKTYSSTISSRTNEEKNNIYLKIKNTIQTRYSNNEIGIKHSKSLLGEEKYNILMNRDFLYKEYIINKRGLTNISKDVEVDAGTIKRFLIKNNIDIRISKSQSYIETFIENWLITNNIKYIKNDRNYIHPYEIDFLCLDYNIGIELCGLYWHSIDNKNLSDSRLNKKYHQNKFIMANNKNIKLLTIFEDEINSKSNIVENRLMYAFNKNINKIYARKCFIKNIDKIVAKSFLKDYHIQSSKTGSINVGLIEKSTNNLVAVATFNKPRYNKEYDLELLRFCTKNCAVVGGLSKIMNIFNKEKIISYSCNRWGNGSGYEKAGFTKIGITPPSYFYFNPKDQSKRYHRTQFQKHKISNENNIHLTEIEIMKNMGYMRIFDCGNTKWEYIKGEI